MKCNICGNTEFADFCVAHNDTKVVRPKAQCATCRSVARTRLLWFYLQKYIKFNRRTRVLHLAPERGVYAGLSKILSPKNYVTADIDGSRYPYVTNFRKIDLTALDNEPSRQFDLILHSHVLEHVPCNIAYTLYHLHRMLKRKGKHVCIIPFLPGKWDECFGDIGDDERQKRFGQYDHVRRFGSDDFDKHLGKLLNLPKDFDAEIEFGEQTLNEANIPAHYRKGFFSGTVLVLNRNDMKLL